MGVSPIVYQMATIREQNVVNTLETSNPIIPPIGLKTNVISPNAIEVSWTDNSLLDSDVIHKYFVKLRWTKVINVFPDKCGR